MKPSTTILLFALLLVISCKKESDEADSPVLQNEITYPDSVYYGKNILSYPDSTVLFDGIEYEIGAVLEQDASLKLIITNYPVNDTATGHFTLWSYWDETGWLAGDYNFVNDTQDYISLQTGEIGSHIQFWAYGQTGSCKIDFYENGNSITRTKYFTWH